MRNCSSIEPLVTPYVDNELAAADRQAIEQHLTRCLSCRTRVGAERSVRELLQSRKQVLHNQCAPAALRARCVSLCAKPPVARVVDPLVANAGARQPTGSGWVRTLVERFGFHGFAGRLAPLTVAVVAVFMAGGLFVYWVTDSSPKLMAAELTADHMKCFMVNAVLRTQHSPQAVEQSLASGFDWNVHLPDNPEREGLELVGSRPCLYGEGKVAHIMYRHNGRPVSLFMLPRSQRADQLVKVLGHEAAIWSVGDRTFVLVSREDRSEVERMAAFVHAAMQ